MRMARMRAALGLSTALCLGSTVAIALYVRLTPLPRAAAAAPSRILGDKGAWVADVTAGTTTRLEVTLDQVPPNLIRAVVDVEDQAFFQHHGVNVRGTARALLADLTSGRIVQGGSSITQQLAKNLFLTNDRSLLRKFRELLYAMQLEMRYDKKQILQQYLNVIYLGDGITGVGAASWHYFGRPVGALDLAQAAMIAGLPRGPELYSPVRHPQQAKMRQLQVLRAMLKRGSITPEQMLAAWREPLVVAHTRTPRTAAPYFTDAVRRSLAVHLPDVALEQAGYSVQTGLNPELQHAVNLAIAHWIVPLPGLQVAVVVQNAQTGDILAYSGGRDYRTSPYDRVRALRQPGSSFKPFVYSAALQHGWTEARTVLSAPTTFVYGGGRSVHWRVHNYADAYAHRPIDMKTAISRSDNVYAVTANLAVGPDRVRDEARQLGLTHSMAPYPALALGVFPVTPLEMARAYATFANGGYLVAPRLFQTVTDASGRTVYRQPVQRIAALPPQIAAVTTDLLQAVMRPGGTGARVAGECPPGTAAKTGTTDTDAWMVGYNGQLVCAVWVGYDRNLPLGPIASHVPAHVFADTLAAGARLHLLGTATPLPPGVVRVAIDPLSSERATSACPRRELDLFVAGSEPTVACTAHPEPRRSLIEQALASLHRVFTWFKRH